MTDTGSVGGSYVSVRSFGAKGNGVTDDTAAIEAAYAASSCVLFPAGWYVYNGAGIDRQEPAVVGLPGSKILLGPDSYFFKTATQMHSLYMQGMAFFGGKGAFLSTFSGVNVIRRRFIVKDCLFYNFTETAIGHNAADWPNWGISDCFFHAANKTTSICIALSGLTDGCSITDCGFGEYRIGIKLDRGGNNCKIRNMDMTTGSTDSAYPVAHVWVVPAPTYSNAGTGFVLEAVKFGNEGLNPGVDHRILYADSDTSGGMFSTQMPSTADSAGYIAGHRVRDISVIGADPVGTPVIYTRTPNVWGSYYGPVMVAGVSPSYLLQYSTVPLAPDRRNTYNVLGPMLLGGEDCVASYCNAVGTYTVHDPGTVQTGNPIEPYGGGGLGTSGAVVLSQPDASAYSGTAARTLTADALGGSDAVTVTYGSEDQGLNLPTIAQANVRAGTTLWVEVDLKSDAAAPLSQMRLYVAQHANRHHFLSFVPPAAREGWVRMRWPLGVREVTAPVTVALLPGRGVTSGVVSVGRWRVYQSREPIPVDIAHRGTRAGFFGAVPTTRPSLPAAGTVTAADIRQALIALGLAQ